ncbi:MAG: twin-arginine translocation signal domain-containing protein [Sulfurifustis sp.]
MSDEQMSEKRREFLKGALAGSGAAVLAAVGGNAAAAPVPKQDAIPKPKQESQGYRETEHVRDYYKTAEF